jgi:NADH-quinone oxidoreductase subunit G
MPNITLNGIQVEVPEGTTILNAAKQVGVEIPHYCYHPKLPIAGSCRMCLVEVEKAPKLMTACSTPVTDGMVISTENEKVRKAVAGVLELLLIHHPLDCPICDQAGECGLQDYYMKFGLQPSRFDLADKHHKGKHQDIGGQIMLDAERCILCSRCVRFLKDVTKTSEMEIFQRGDHSEIGIFPGRTLDNNYTGNLADSCPVGALTNKDFRFKCRVWFLSSAKSVCTGCANGCNIDAHFREQTMYRVKPRVNDAVNQAWMCDFGRLEYKKANEDRLAEPTLREGGSDRTPGWDSVLNEVALRLKETADHDGPDSVAVIASPQSSNEELFLVRKLATEVLGTQNLAFTSKTPGEGFSDDFLIKADKNPNTKGAQLLGISESGFDALLQKIADRKIKALLVFGNALGDLGEQEVSTLMSGVQFSVLAASNESALSRSAQVILPAATVFERSGTFTNFAGRVQRFSAGFPPRGNARPELDIVTGIANRLGAGWSYDGEAAVFAGIAAAAAPFSGMSHDTVGEQGQNVSEAGNA